MVDQKVKLCVGISACLILIMSIIAMVLVFLVKKQDTSSNLVITDIQNNLNSRGIMDITANTTGKCTSPYTPLLNNEFPGTDNLCECINDDTKQKKLTSIYKSACVLVSGYTCKKIKWPAAHMKTYRGKTLCAKRSQFSYEGYTAIGLTESCASGYKVCGHTISKKLCLKDSYKCPLNTIRIQKTPLSAEDIARNLDYKTIDLDDGYKMHFSNKATGSKIITQFKTGYSPMCVSPEETIVPVDFENSGLDKSMDWVTECEETMGTSKTTDPRWTKMDNHSLQRLYAENGYFKNYEDTSSISPTKLNNSKHYLYERSYGDWNKKCTSDPNKSISENLTDLSSNQEGESKRALSIAAITILIIAAISALIWLIYTFLPNSKQVLVMGCWVWMCLLLIAAVIVCSILFYRCNKDLPSDSEKWKQAGCGDSTTSGLINNVVEKKSQYWKWALGALCLTGGSLALMGGALFAFKGKGSSNNDDIMRKNEHSNYSEMIEGDNDVYENFNPADSSSQAYPEVMSQPHYIEPEVNARTYAPEQTDQVDGNDFFDQEGGYDDVNEVNEVQNIEYKNTQPEYFNNAPQELYQNPVQPETNYFQNQQPTTYVQSQPTTTYVQPTTTYVQPTTTYVQNQPTTSNYTYGQEPYDQVNYGNNTVPTNYAGEPSTRYYTSSGREITRDQAHPGNYGA